MRHIDHRSDLAPSLGTDYRRPLVSIGAVIRTACIVAIGGASHDALSATVQLPTRTVALSGRTAPGGGEANFSGFSSPAINVAGQTAFDASLVVGGGVNTSNDTGTWSEGSGTLALVAREGFAAPGTSGANFSDFAPPSYEFNSLPGINSAGGTVFRRFLQTGGSVNSSNDVGLWSGGSGGLSLVAREGSLAPGTGGATFGGGAASYPFVEDPVFNDAGQAAFRGLLQTGGSVSSSNNTGIWSEGSGTLALVARENSTAPGTGGERFSVLQRPVINGVGETAFLATLQSGGSVGSSNNSGIWSEASGSLALVAREGTTAPGTGGERFGDFVRYFVPNQVAINDAGQTAFLALLQEVDSSSDFGMWSEGSGHLALVARKGSPAPGTDGANFGGLSLPVINGAGRTAFSGILQTGGPVDSSNDSGIWSEGFGTLELVAREGAPAPGIEGTNFGHFLFSRPVINRAGQTAFLAPLRSGETGIWAQDTSSVLRRVVCEGDLLEVADDDFRTISGLGFVIDSGNEDGRRSGFNDLGQVAFHATFTDGSSGVFVTSVPEPSTLALCCTVLLVLLAFAQRKRLTPADSGSL